METECYPCIPMHSASNQKRMNHSTVTMIKQEPLSEDVNVVVDDMRDTTEENRSLLHTNFRTKIKKKSAGFLAATKLQQQTKLHNRLYFRLFLPLLTPSFFVCYNINL